MCSYVYKAELSFADFELSKSHEPSNFIKFLSNKCITLFTCAASVLDDICSKIETSTVTLQQLSLLKKRAEDVKKLFAANFHNKERMNHFIHILDEKFKEYGQFLRRLERLGLLCQNIDIPVKGKRLCMFSSRLKMNCFFLFST